MVWVCNAAAVDRHRDDMIIVGETDCTHETSYIKRECIGPRPDGNDKECLRAATQRGGGRQVLFLLLKIETRKVQ
jgi:hypothetical protein